MTLPALLVLCVSLGCVPKASAPRQPTPVERRAEARPTVIESTIRASAPTAIPTVRPTPVVESHARPLAVIIENAPDARPQAGLSQADLVVEAMTEGGISRFMAVFSSQEPAVVGPVRSARHYFVALAAELGAPLVHFGASPRGYEEISTTKLPTVDGITGNGPFWRDPRRAAPHNAYTSVADARASVSTQWPSARIETMAVLGNQLTPWSAPSVGRHISLAFRPWQYRANFDFDEARQMYTRSTDGEIQRDAAGGVPLQAGTIAILTIPGPIVDASGRLDIALRGEGDLILVSLGTAERGRWLKRSSAEPLHFVSATGQSLTPPRAPLWVEIVQPETQVDVN
ncbi:MAG: DUF3048 domain-containing protein [Chloroflexota bacterium]